MNRYKSKGGHKKCIMNLVSAEISDVVGSGVCKCSGFWGRKYNVDSSYDCHQKCCTKPKRKGSYFWDGEENFCDFRIPEDALGREMRGFVEFMFNQDRFLSALKKPGDVG